MFRLSLEMLQVCTVNLIVRKLETSVMEITPHIITMESETVLTQYIITNWTLAYNNASNVDMGIQMTVVLKRRILNAILTVYLPTGTYVPVQVVQIVNSFECLPTHSAGADHRLRDQLLQGLLLRGDRDSEPHLSPGLDHLVHQRLWCLAANGRSVFNGILTIMI